MVREGILSPEEWENFKKIIYVPTEPSKIHDEMTDFIAEIERMLTAQEPILKIAAYLHTRLVHIHPFDTGNGRTATVMMYAFLLANNMSAVPLPSQSVSSEERDKYITAVRDAEENLNAFERYLISRKQCSACNKWKQNLKRCTSCKKVYYCDGECQKKDWLVHKISCNK